jgi:hypothetical protein
MCVLKLCQVAGVLDPGRVIRYLFYKIVGMTRVRKIKCSTSQLTLKRYTTGKNFKINLNVIICLVLPSSLDFFVAVLFRQTSSFSRKSVPFRFKPLNGLFRDAQNSAK